MTDPTPAFFNEAAREAAACRIGTWTNQWGDPENGPFDGGESDYLRELADVALSAALATLSDEELVERVARCLYEHGMGYDIDADPVARESMFTVARTVLTALGLPVAEREATG